MRTQSVCSFLFLLVTVAYAAAQGIDGTWDAWLETPGGKLRFTMKAVHNNSDRTVEIINAGEKQTIPRVQNDGRYVNIDIAHYNSTIAAELSEDGQRLDGDWRKIRGRDEVATLPFHAKRRPADARQTPINVDRFAGRWKVNFSSDEQPAVAIIRESDGDKPAWGTFLTTTGDYRYLTPQVQGDQIELSCFDGAHAFLFRAKLQPDGSMIGDFWSGDWWHESWTAVRDNEFNLPSALEVTKWNDQVKLSDLVYSDLEGNRVSLGDPQFNSQARILEIFGSWCPNCHDAAIYLSELHDKYADKGLSVIGLAFEVTGDPVRDAQQVQRYRERHKITFPCLLAGTSKKEEASKQIPLLDRVRSYPTTIFIDRDNSVRAVYTGFSGPATGEANEKLKHDFESAIESLLD